MEFSDLQQLPAGVPLPHYRDALKVLRADQLRDKLKDVEAQIGKHEANVARLQTAIFADPVDRAARLAVREAKLPLAGLCKERALVATELSDVLKASRRA
jgi:hypothetical protein